jgi:hypothetical protein
MCFQRQRNCAGKDQEPADKREWDPALTPRCEAAQIFAAERTPCADSTGDLAGRRDFFAFCKGVSADILSKANAHVQRLTAEC